MTIDLDDEILQDFLVEAGEILELLGEQLVDLEKSPEDPDLLNAIFRGFHTIKGGAGFLAIDALVGVCHKAEDVFDVLRQGKRKVTPDLMDVILQVVDIVNEMFDNVRSGEMPASAESELLESLQSYTQPGEEVPAQQETVATIEPEPQETATAIGSELQETIPITPEVDDNESRVIKNAADAVEQEFAAMMGIAEEPAQEQEQIADGEITEAEFDELLVELHGKGGSPTPKQTNAQAPEVSTNEITEAEFDNLLDELHGKGKFTGVPEASQEQTEEQEKPVEVFEQTSVEQVTKTENIVPIKKQAVVPSSSKPAKAATAKQGETTVRVDTQVLDEIMNMVGELVLVRNRFQTLGAVAEDEQISKAVSNLDVVTADLQLSVMKTRMQPIKKVFGRFPRVVRDLARSLNKEIKLEMVGEDTDLDKNLVEALADPLVHLVRNAVDHGIEDPEDRAAAGKPREGTVVLAASQEGDHIQLSIKDDGKGMNADVLRQIAVEKGLMDEESAARLEDKECYNLIFAPGFSTKTEISDVSGRGVGMDVVKTRITQMNGTVEIDSKEGQGSTIIIKVPLTLAIMPTLMIKLGGQAFALPLASVLEILELDLNANNVVDGQLVVMVRNRALPLFYLGEWLVNAPDYNSRANESGHVVVVNAGGKQIGFVVDQLIGQEEVVIKPLGAKLQGLDGLSGATITGDGQIALILDVPGMLKAYAA